MVALLEEEGSSRFSFEAKKAKGPTTGAQAPPLTLASIWTLWLTPASPVAQLAARYDTS